MASTSGPGPIQIVRSNTALGGLAEGGWIAFIAGDLHGRSSGLLLAYVERRVLYLLKRPAFLPRHVLTRKRVGAHDCVCKPAPVSVAAPQTLWVCA